LPSGSVRKSVIDVSYALAGVAPRALLLPLTAKRFNSHRCYLVFGRADQPVTNAARESVDEQLRIVKCRKQLAGSDAICNSKWQRRFSMTAGQCVAALAPSARYEPVVSNNRSDIR
jgi:hypothetical protein